MSTPAAATTPPRRSSAGRYLFLFLLGLVIGVIAVVILLRQWEARKTPTDRWYDAVMTILAVHDGQLESDIKANRCSANDAIPRLQAMRMLANDIEPASGDLADDQRFKDHASKFRATLDTALTTPATSCAGLATAVKSIGAACGACQQEFRD